MKFWRIFIGGIAVVVALWIIIGEQLAGASADATINARLVTLRSPIAGTVTVPPRPLGSSVSTGEVVASVQDERVDGVRLDDLQMERAFAEAAVARLTTLRDETQAIIATLTTRSEAFHQARLVELGIRLEFARERLNILESGGLPEAFGLRPPESADVVTDTADELPGLRELWINAVNERIALLENELETARNGVYLGDGYNDAPNSEQRIVELQSEVAARTAELGEAEARLKSVSNRMAKEQRRVALAEGRDLASPVNGVYWEALAADREQVQRGDAIARFLDCGSTIVTLSVSESVYNTLSVGEEARFRPSGGERTFAATILRNAGAGAATLYRNLAVAPSARHLQRYDVLLLVPELAADPEFGCAIGRTGRVFFQRRPLDWLRSLWG